MPDSIMAMEAPAFRNRSPEIDKLAAALVKAQSAMTGATKDATNPHFKNNYADLASVWDAVRKPLTDNGLAVLQFPRTVENGVEIETTLLHATGQYLKDVLWVPASKQDAQGIGSAITYGRRYALMSVTGIAPVDDDGNAAAASYKPNGVINAQTRSIAVDPADQGMVQGEGRNQYQTDKDKKAALWADAAIGTIRLPGQTVESLDTWWKIQMTAPPGKRIAPLTWLEDNASDHHERVLAAFDEVRDNLAALAA